eukprot:7586027-Lingulodinium_polyedra.AAC.1
MQLAVEKSYLLYLEGSTWKLLVECTKKQSIQHQAVVRNLFQYTMDHFTSKEALMKKVKPTIINSMSMKAEDSEDASAWDMC